MLTAIMPSCSARSQLGRAAEQAEAGIVDDEFDLETGRGQRRRDPVAGIGLLEIAGNDDRRSAAGGDDFVRQRRQPVGAPRHQRHAMAIRRENARQLRADARRGAGNQRHTLGHESMLLNKLQDNPASDRNESIGLRTDASHPPAYPACANARVLRRNSDFKGKSRQETNANPRHIKISSCPAIARRRRAARAVSRRVGDIRAARTTAGRARGDACLRSIRSRDEMPSRSAARQTTLSSNSLTWPSA